LTPGPRALGLYLENIGAPDGDLSPAGIKENRFVGNRKEFSVV